MSGADSYCDEEEVIEFMTKIEPLLLGYSRSVIVLACIRIIAAMLGPAKDETREATIREIPGTITSMLAMMDATIGREEGS